MVNSFNKNGTIHVPKKIRQELPSDTVKVYTTEINGKKVVVLEPVGKEKTPTVIYK